MNKRGHKLRKAARFNHAALSGIYLVITICFVSIIFPPIMHHPDLILLDVMMPEMDGFEMPECIPNPDFEVIFITTSDQFAIKAIRMSALDYLHQLHR